MIIRDADDADLPAIVAMYADDDLGSTREVVGEPLDPGYVRAFQEIKADPRHRLVVAETDDRLVGTLQLSFIPHLVLRGAERAQIEAVRVRSGERSIGVGQALIEWAVEAAQERGCRLVQLTTNASRADAQRFYQRLGFEPSHVGMKLALPAT